MLIDHRTYTVKPGTMTKQLALYTTVEFPHRAPHLCLGFDDFQDGIDW